MIIVLMWILMGMISVSMIVCMGSEDLLDQVDHEESSEEGIYRIGRMESHFGEDVDE
jgi:hypothetical protein